MSSMSAQAGVSGFGPGQTIGGRFEIQSMLSEDGFGSLLNALDRKTGRQVALRIVRASAVTPNLRAEVKAAAALNHANLVATFGLASADDGATMIVQGPLGARHLSDYTVSLRESGRPISLRGAYNVVAHVCNALTAAHASVGPHGAVRPEAVWIGDDGRVGLADLAIARATLSTPGTAGLPPKEAAYLAPEIKGGGAPVAASDIFGLGALLYVLLTGRSPMDDFIAPSEAHPEATPAVDAELLRALSPDPSARHPTPDAFRTALLEVSGSAEQETTEDFGVDIEVEVNLASIAPSQRPPAHAVPVLQIPGAPRMPTLDAPQAGMRVSMGEAFRVSIIEDEQHAEAARARRSLGEVDLKDVLAKITEDDAPRWMLVKEGMDHGPFSGRQVVNMIVQGDALRDHELMNTDTGARGKIGGFPEFQDFLQQYELRRAEQDRAQALVQSEVQEQRGDRYKLAIGLGVVALVAVLGGLYAVSRASKTDDDRGAASVDDLYKRGAVEISGSAGILPVPRGGRRGGGGGSMASLGAGASYEDAMMVAIDIGSAASGGEQQLNAGTVAGVMNKNLNRIFDSCVKGSVGKVTVDIAIAGSGQVMGVSVRAGDAGFQRCVADQVRRVRFPAFSAPRMGARYSFDT
jgi:serine/threonine protein kinase